jgi:serine phosphatase RsbU (regulator of sigma subunit)/pSer/pThr/pTyr-binding forkhead associated (FHA) protein
MAHLFVEAGTDAGQQFALDKPIVSLGRSVTNTIQVVDRRMSRNHAEIHINNGRFTLRDLGSRNGTLVNGQLVGQPVELLHNDRIQIGDTIIRVDIEAAPGSPGSHDSSGTDTSAKDSGSISNGAIKVVEEKQWGATRGERRAGYDPSLGAPLESTSIYDIKQPTRRLEIMYQVTDAIRSVFELSSLMDRIISIIQTVVRPDRTYLLLMNQETGVLEPSVVKVRPGESSTEIKISTSIVNRCLKDGVSLLVSDATMDERFNSSESIILNAIRTAMVAPLIFKQESIGVIYVDTQSRSAAFMDEELELLTSIANQAAVAITNARLQAQILEQHKLAREMEIARTIQMNLLPKTYPEIPGYQISAMSLPAKQVGGDYYDFLEMPDGRMAFAIADVSGKGVPAAILTATTRSYLQSETQHKDSSLPQTVARMNRMVHRDVTNDMYVTMVLALLDPFEGRFEYVNAGHSHPYIFLPNGDVQPLATGGLFLGIDEDATYQHDYCTIPPGGVLIFYTDGVIDILNPAGESYGYDAFMELVKDKRHLSAEEIRNAIYQACLKHRAGADQFDDFTLIILKRLDFNDSELD